MHLGQGFSGPVGQGQGVLHTDQLAFAARSAGQLLTVERIGDQAAVFRSKDAGLDLRVGLVMRSGTRVYVLSYQGTDKGWNELRRMSAEDAEAAVEAVATALASTEAAGRF